MYKKARAYDREKTRLHFRVVDDVVDGGDGAVGNSDCKKSRLQKQHRTE